MRTRPSIPDTELNRGGELLPDGEYDFQVKSATDKTSSSGNDMIELVLTLWGPDGNERTLWDYLVDQENAEWKTRAFARATGLEHCYDSGSFAARDCINASGKCLVRTQKARTVNGTTYDPRNIVKGYIDPNIEDAPKAKPAIEGAGKKRAPAAAPPPEKGELVGPGGGMSADDIPFHHGFHASNL